MTESQEDLNNCEIQSIKPVLWDCECREGESHCTHCTGTVEMDQGCCKWDRDTENGPWMLIMGQECSELTRDIETGTGTLVLDEGN